MSLRPSLIASAALVLAACNPPATETAPSATQQTQPAPAEQAAPQGLPRTSAPDGARVYIIEPQDGATVASPVRVVFGLSGAGVAPAGIDAPATGHHHLLLDTPLPPLDLPIPADERHVHFGGGQTETAVTLAPGQHTLQLLLGDELHIPHDPPLYSDVVTVQVQ